jgi:hypothetical protein
MTHTVTMSQHTYSDHVTAPESFSITNGYVRNQAHSTFRIHLAADSGHWNWNERVSMSHSSLNNRDNFPKTAWEVCKYYMISLFVKKLLLHACSMSVLHPVLCRFLHSWILETGFWNVQVSKCWFSNASLDICSNIKNLFCLLLSFNCWPLMTKTWQISQLHSNQ